MNLFKESQEDDGQRYRLILSGKYHDALWQKLSVTLHGKDMWTSGISHGVVDLLNKAARSESFDQDSMEKQYEAAEGSDDSRV